MSLDKLQREINLVTKKALKGDIDSAISLLDFLISTNVKEAIATAYLLVYQIAMNVYMDLGEDCKRCGGICCKSGPPIELYDFDVKDLIEAGIDAYKYVVKENSKYYIRRPCPFQDGWRCKIHSFKPYACLCYPFAVEDLQKGVIESWSPPEPPKPFIPSFCIAGLKAWKCIESIINEYKNRFGEAPSPKQLLIFITTNNKIIFYRV